MGYLCGRGVPMNNKKRSTEQALDVHCAHNTSIFIILARFMAKVNTKRVFFVKKC